MAHIIEIERNSEVEARSFLDALYYSDFVSPIGFRVDGETVWAVAVNWNEEGLDKIDEQFSQITTETLENGKELDEISVYSRIFPETTPYRPEWQV